MYKLDSSFDQRKDFKLPSLRTSIDRTKINFDRLRMSSDKNKINPGLNNTMILTSVREDREKKIATNLNLSIQIAAENPYWTELKTSGKNISKRCYHVSVIYENKLYVHGGYELNTGRMRDFMYVRIGEDFGLQGWQLVKCNSQLQPGPLCRHTGLLWQNKLHIFGGQTSTIENTKTLWVFDFVDRTWSKYEPKPNSDQIWPCSVHSHSCNLYTDDEGREYMLISFGFLGEKIADHTNEVWAYDLQGGSWTNLFAYTQNTAMNAPDPRSGQATAVVKGMLYVFGGDDNDRRLNDMWSFDLKSCEWRFINLQGKIVPEPRFGHTMEVYNNKTLIMFGGFQDIAHERDDLMAFDTVLNEWQTMEIESIAGKSIEKRNTNTNTELESSPSPRRSRMSMKNTIILGHRFRSENNQRLSSEKNKPNETNSYLNSSIMGFEGLSASMQQRKARKLQDFLNKKKLLLDRFEVADPKMIMELRRPSPTTQTLKHSLHGIATPRGFKANSQTTEIDFYPKRDSIITPRLGAAIKQLPLIRDGKISGRRAGARDGHSAHIFRNHLLIFGGDRHKLSYNDIFIFDLDKYFNS